ncbi:MAG: hypothetical protein ACKVT0_07330, partial [Planctomycetaceae bacterium]
ALPKASERATPNVVSNRLATRFLFCLYVAGALVDMMYDAVSISKNRMRRFSDPHGELERIIGFAE